MHTVYLSLGSNLGNRKRLLHDAIGMIGEQVGCVERESSFIETEPWGFASPNKFLNCCVKVLTSLSPHQLLETTQHIECEMGRTQKSVDGQYHDRVIDIDILLYDRVSVNDETDTRRGRTLYDGDVVCVDGACAQVVTDAVEEFFDEATADDDFDPEKWRNL